MEQQEFQAWGPESEKQDDVELLEQEYPQEEEKIEDLEYIEQEAVEMKKKLDTILEIAEKVGEDSLDVWKKISDFALELKKQYGEKEMVRYGNYNVITGNSGIQAEMSDFEDQRIKIFIEEIFAEYEEKLKNNRTVISPMDRRKNIEEMQN